MDLSQTSQETRFFLRAHLDNIDDLVIEFKDSNAYDYLLDYDHVCKKVLQGFQYVASGKKNIRLVLLNFYGKDIGRQIPIYNPKNWNSLLVSMIERGVSQIEVRVVKLGELRTKRIRAKQVPVEFNQDGEIESAEDEAILEAITKNTPLDEPYKGDSVVRCHFCQHTSRDEKVSRESGPFYGPFEGKKYAHLLCLLWMSYVYLDEDLHLCKVKDAIRESQTMKCKFCKNKGASFYCHAKGCRTMAHYRCAHLNNWYFDWANFRVYCPKEQIIQSVELSASTKTLTNRQKARLQAKMQKQVDFKEEDNIKREEFEIQEI